MGTTKEQTHKYFLTIQSGARWVDHQNDAWAFPNRDDAQTAIKAMRILDSIKLGTTPEELKEFDWYSIHGVYNRHGEVSGFLVTQETHFPLRS